MCSHWSQEKHQAFEALHNRLGVSLRNWLLDIANDNEDQPNHEILASHEIVFAVWDDESRPHGVGLWLVKGDEYFSGGLPGDKFVERTSAFKCAGEAEARGLVPAITRH